ncbi:hemin-degrading factor [Acidovorax sp. GBBC 3334]|uniref:hemin-degrading factor n=1 Tax=Acidovorax sp. GBBC 3334 TaxID=2940496 RepID=UPI0023046D74|nr:ChuX/HutX family heme-like substrate-binding protein [Acidovorax sp. GBBC 3334]MDA8457009.1 hemin-degrading factor [Acidovorax sp. GBBC 3334]
MSAVLAASPPAPQVREQFAAARAAGRRARDAALHLGLPEGAAIAAHAGLHAHPLKATPLQGAWLEMLQALEACGPLMALTRNEGAVHEKTGIYRNVSASGPQGRIGIAPGPDIDLRLFFQHWHAAYAVTEPGRTPLQPPARSLQFFDAHGDAMHKVYLREAGDAAAFEAVAARFAEPSAGYVFRPRPPRPLPRPDGAIDAEGFLQAWAGLQDTHDFFGLLARFGVARQQGLRLAEGRFARRIAPDGAAVLLQAAAATGLPIMVFVGNAGCIQIHTGPVRRVEPLETPAARWINVLDAGFNLHLRTDRIAETWAVEKPTADGVVTSVEVFDAEGEVMAMFFGERKPGREELPGWRTLVAGLRAP